MGPFFVCVSGEWVCVIWEWMCVGKFVNISMFFKDKLEMGVTSRSKSLKASQTVKGGVEACVVEFLKE